MAEMRSRITSMVSQQGSTFFEEKIRKEKYESNSILDDEGKIQTCRQE